MAPSMTVLEENKLDSIFEMFLLVGEVLNYATAMKWQHYRWESARHAGRG